MRLYSVSISWPDAGFFVGPYRTELGAIKAKRRLEGDPCYSGGEFSFQQCEVSFWQWLKGSDV